ncbi:hypothetical protein J2X72_002598 [Phyllobacterium sp. 1468]|nr:hypothetical protein [Phyllobacterium sp. 1468]MDR6633798.1 hypothetical protein [Phyllobacterium sp. 1468]
MRDQDAWTDPSLVMGKRQAVMVVPPWLPFSFMVLKSEAKISCLLVAEPI